MHSFEVKIRICQPEKVMSKEVKPKWTSDFLKLTNPDVNLKDFVKLYDFLGIIFIQN